MSRFWLTLAALSLLGGCQATDPIAKWDFDRCQAEGGTVLTGDPPRCQVDDEIHLLGTNLMHIPKQEATAGYSILNWLQLNRAEQLQSWQPLEDPMLGDKAIALTVEDEVVLIFQYASVKALETELQTLVNRSQRADGTPIRWPSRAHYFAKGKELAVYLGTNPQVFEILRESTQ